MEGNKEPWCSCCLSCGKKRACFSGLLLGVALTIIFLFSAGLLRYSHEEKNVNVFDEAFQTRPVSLPRRYPDAIIIGAKKGGTRALLDMLNIHPQVMAAKGEVHFFDREENYGRGRRWYLSRMPVPQSETVKVIEKTPAYFVSPSVPQRMRDTLPSNKSVRLILIVRDPITRSISDYTQLHSKRTARMNVRNSPSMSTFEQIVLTSDGRVRESTNIITFSLYDIHYQRWREYFTKDQILVVNGDKLINNPLDELKSVERFLRIPSYFTASMFYYNQTKGFYCWRKPRQRKIQTTIAVKPVCLGNAKGRTHPTVSNTTIQTLKAYFRPHMQIFCNFSGIEYAWCNY